MDTAPTDPANAASGESAHSWPRLFHRWFIQYNPLYLLSAALVLAGCILWSAGLVHEESLVGPLGVAGVAELYAVSLIGGAALLTRIGFRRPAVLLALITIVFQWDSTLHTETCAFLGAVGPWATAGWLALFVVKLYALAWAVKIRFTTHAMLPAGLAAIGLALAPHLLSALGGRNAGALVAVWLFALAASYRPGALVSLVPLDRWGHTVLRRTTRAAWLLSAALVGMHVLMWWQDHDLRLSALVLASPLFLVRYLRREWTVWMTLASALLFAVGVQPSAFFVVALLATGSLCLRAIAPLAPAAPDAQPVAPDAAGVSPYRVPLHAFAPQQPVAVAVAPGPVVVSSGERARYFTGAIFTAYFAAWTARWAHGAWPGHILALDILLTLGIVLFVVRSRRRMPIVPLIGNYAHWVLAARLIPMPQTSVQWGETIVAVGFALLGGSLYASFRWRGYAGEYAERGAPTPHPDPAAPEASPVAS